MNINDIFEELNLHFRRIDAIVPEIEKWQPLDAASFNETEKVKT